MLSKTVVALSLFPLALSTPISLLSRQDASDTSISDADAVSIEAAANATATDPSVLAAESAGKGGACSDMIVVFARGTTEPAPIGTLTGPPFVKAIQKAIGSSTMNVQGVDYPADIAGFLAGGDKGGSSNMAQMITAAVTNCPNSAVVMSGYSQGGQLVHNAANELPASTMAKVSSVVIFGDPDDGEPVTGASAAKTKVICHAGDNICDHGDLILTPHLTYSVNADEAAAFVAANAGINSKE